MDERVLEGVLYGVGAGIIVGGLWWALSQSGLRTKMHVSRAKD